MFNQFRKGSLTRLVTTMIHDLPDRHREVLQRRYGMAGGEKETLEAIGEDFDITRERVRQIEHAGFGMLARSGAKDQAERTFSDLREYLAHHGALRREERLLQELAPGGEGGELLFLLDMGDVFSRHHERDWHWSFWASSEDAKERAERFLGAFCKELAVRGSAYAEGEFLAFAKDFCAQRNFAFTEPVVQSYVDVSRKIEQGPFGEWGLVEWPEVAPRGVRDRAYLVLKRVKKPLHFRDVAEHIDGFRARGELDWPKPNVQTVHNELLKDDRFVLIGRGLYALRDWGYESGTVRDVIAAVLASASKPLTKEEVVADVLKRREVKPTTILLNLHNKKNFARTADGRYSVHS